MRKRRGSILLGVLAVLFVLSLAAFGLHWQQRRTRATFLREQADLEARQASQFELAKAFSESKPDVPHLEMRAHSSLDPAPQEPDAAQLFSGPSDLSATRKVSWNQDLQAGPWSSWLEIRLNSDEILPAPDKRHFRAVSRSTFPYAALAPQGSVSLQSLTAWSNGPFAKELVYSALPARAGAAGDIVLEQANYTELFSQKGKIQVKSGTAFGQQGYLPYLERDYLKKLAQQLDQACTALSQRAQNKSSAIRGPLFAPADIWGLLTGSTAFERNISLAQSLSFPFPMIPGGSQIGFVISLWFHMPFPPDGGDESTVPQFAALGEESARLTGQAGPKNEELLKLQAEQKKLKPDSQEWKAKQALIDQKKAELTELKSSADALSARSKNMLQSLLAHANPQDGGPPTRAEETWSGEEGPTGWSYGRVFGSILSLFGKILSGQFQELGQSLINQCRLVHFGPEDNPIGFDIQDNSFSCAATLNVPAGRSLSLDGDLTVIGDLWLQKGASLTVHGNLKLVSPPVRVADDPLLARGRLCLEEGSSLVVSGNFTATGDPHVGSMLVGGPLHGVHPVTAALLVKGDIDLPFGVLPALSLDEVPELERMLINVAPNLGKAAGPFHRRKAYFAKYATTFEIIEWPWPPAIIVLPIPLPHHNILNPIFNSLSIIYSSRLNLTLGENFLTCTDWWFFGKDSVAMLPKVDWGEFPKLAVPRLPKAEPEVVSFVKEYAGSVAKDMVKELVAEVVVKLIVAQMGFPLPPLLEDWLTEAVGTLINRISEADEAEELGGEETRIELGAPLEKVREVLAAGEFEALLGQCPGALIYAGGKLSTGGPLSVGWLVAQGDVDCQSETLAGALLSLGGNATARRLLFVPDFTRASVYLPQPGGSDWLQATLNELYGKELDSGEGLPVGPAVPHFTAEVWER